MCFIEFNPNLMSRASGFHASSQISYCIPAGNFMLLTTEIDSPLKAIDFGLAVFYDPAKLPRTDLGLEGTTWCGCWT